MSKRKPRVTGKAEIMHLAVVWAQPPGRGRVAVTRGYLVPGARRAMSFSLKSGRTARLPLAVRADTEALADGAMRVTIVGKRTFTFFPKDVTSAHPLLVPEYGVAVTTADDRRDYRAIVEAVRRAGTVDALDVIASEPEESYETAAAGTRVMTCPTWLGLGRDMRIFRVSPNSPTDGWGLVVPAYHSVRQAIPETGDKPVEIIFHAGMGASCRRPRIVRRLDDGVLPILHSTQEEDGIRYDVTAFATMEKGPIEARRVHGPDWKIAYAHTGGQMLTPEEKEALKGASERERHGQAEELLCWVRLTAVNTDRVPRYAWFKTPFIVSGSAGLHQFEMEKYLQTGCEDGTGFLVLKGGRIGAASRLNGAPFPRHEYALLLQPGEQAVVDFLIPHTPLDRRRAERLRKQEFGAHLEACRVFWRKKLAVGTQIEVPERGIDERIRAGLLHCDIAAIGEPKGPLLATIGCYAPIGSESAPIIQFMDAMGRHKLAEQCLDFFLARQRPDGFIQNFAGYQLETGPFLWTMGEHFRYTRDRAWVRRVTPAVRKACDYLLAWRERNKTAANRKKNCWGLIDGKTADPEDFFHSYMLNALTWLGLARAVELFAVADPARAGALAAEVAAYRHDIRASYAAAVGRAPLIPMGDGTWTPSFSPWSEYDGPLALFAEGGNWLTHGAFGSRDSLIGPTWLLMAELIDPNEELGRFLLRANHRLFTVRNGGLSQPYYVRHDYGHLLRGEVPAFLKVYYNQMAALQDRETYTIWEHYFQASQHKTHEEAWLLMQTRWMLWLERGDMLSLLQAIPRKWLEPGKRLRLRGAVSYFGAFDLDVRAGERTISAEVVCRTDRKPAYLRIRLPHPEGRRAVAVSGGVYDAASESVTVNRFSGKARVEATFA